MVSPRGTGVVGSCNKSDYENGVVLQVASYHHWHSRYASRATAGVILRYNVHKRMQLCVYVISGTEWC